MGKSLLGVTKCRHRTYVPCIARTKEGKEASAIHVFPSPLSRSSELYIYRERGEWKRHDGREIVSCHCITHALDFDENRTLSRHFEQH